MERFDIRMFTSAWGKYYDDANHGVWMPPLGMWREGSWKAGNERLHVNGASINPAPLVCIVARRIHDIPMTVSITYKTAILDHFENVTELNRRYSFPVYIHSQEKTTTFTIPAFSDIDTVFRICEDDNQIYDIVNVEVTSEYRRDETFIIYALASPTSRLIYAQGWHKIYEDLIRMKRATWSCLSICGNCGGVGTIDGETCPECDGYRFSGTNATGYLLDRIGYDVGLIRNLNEPDETFAKRVWARKWHVIPVESEIRKYFEHFAHIKNPDGLYIIKTDDVQEPTFFVCIDPYLIGSKAIWQQGDQYLDYDGMVERICPAGVNGYFRWLLQGKDTFDIDDSNSEIQYQMLRDIYGATVYCCELLSSKFDEMRDFNCSHSGIFKAWENFTDPHDWTYALDILSSFLGHDKVARLHSGDVHLSAIDEPNGNYQFDAYICYTRNLAINIQSIAGIGVFDPGDTTSYAAIAFCNFDGTTRLYFTTSLTNFHDTGVDVTPLKWYHIHVEAYAMYYSVYVNSIHVLDIPMDTMAFPSALMINYVESDTELIVDAFDGSWDEGYGYESDGTTCKTRNMLCEPIAPNHNKDNGGENPELDIAVNDWIQGIPFELDYYRWTSCYEGKEIVLRNTDFITVPVQVAIPKLPYRIEYNYWSQSYHDWIHRRVVAGNGYWAVYDDHLLVNHGDESLELYDIEEEYISGVVLDYLDFANLFGGIVFDSESGGHDYCNRLLFETPDYWTPPTCYSLWSHHKGMALCAKIWSSTSAQYIIDTDHYMLGGGGYWQGWIFLDPGDATATFKVEFKGSLDETIGKFTMKEGAILHDGTKIGAFDKRRWNKLNISWSEPYTVFKVEVNGHEIADDLELTEGIPETIEIGWDSIVAGSTAYISGIHLMESDQTMQTLPASIYDEYSTGKYDALLTGSMMENIEDNRFIARRRTPTYIKSVSQDENGCVSIAALNDKVTEPMDVLLLGSVASMFPKKVERDTKKGCSVDFYGEDFKDIVTSGTVAFDFVGSKQCVSIDGVGYIRDYFGRKDDGYIELYLDVDAEDCFIGLFDEDGNEAITMEPVLVAGSGWHSIRIQFETDTYNTYIDGILVDNGESYEADDISSIKIYTDNAGALVYIANIGYSWDPYYALGDNAINGKKYTEDNIDILDVKRNLCLFRDGAVYGRYSTSFNLLDKERVMVVSKGLNRLG